MTSSRHGRNRVIFALVSIVASCVFLWPCVAVLPTFRPQPPVMCCLVWHDVPGAQITDTLATSDLARAPDETLPVARMEFQPGFKDKYACSITGLITAPVTGGYIFHIAARDSGVLFLSTDETPAKRRYIAETPAATDLHNYRAYSAQTSEAIPLVAGKRYFIQVVGKSGPGPGGISIAWNLPNGVFQGPIPADRFSPVSEPPPPPSLRVDQFRLTLKPEPGPTTQPGIHDFVRGAEFEVDGQSAEMSYLISLPKNFDTTNDARPMLVFLHGNNRQGYDLQPIMQTGPMRDLDLRPQLRDWLPMIVLCPQLPPEWRWDTPGAAQAVNGLVEQLCQRYPRIDRRRIYLTGLSMGGKGTWLTLENAPQLYAAAVPISAVDVRPDQAPQSLKNLPGLHIVCGSEDGGFTAGSHRMYEALKSALGDRLQFTVFEHEGHSVWDHMYADRAFYEQLLKYSR
jgi:predicted esterase